MKTDNEIKDMLKNLPEHKLPDGFRESVMDAVQRVAIFDALEYKSVKAPIKRPRYVFRYAGLIAAVLVLGVMWISGTLRPSYGLDETAYITRFTMPEAEVEYEIEQEMWGFDFEDIMPFLIPEAVIDDVAVDIPAFDRVIPMEEEIPALERTAPMAAIGLHIEDEINPEPIWSPPWVFMFVLVSVGVLLAIASFLIHFKRSGR